MPLPRVYLNAIPERVAVIDKFDMGHGYEHGASHTHPESRSIPLYSLIGGATCFLGRDGTQMPPLLIPLQDANDRCAHYTVHSCPGIVTTEEKEKLKSDLCSDCRAKIGKGGCSTPTGSEGAM